MTDLLCLNRSWASECTLLLCATKRVLIYRHVKARKAVDRKNRRGTKQRSGREKDKKLVNFLSCLFPRPRRSDRALIGGFLQLYQVSSKGGEREEVKLTEGGPCVSPNALTTT